MNNDKREQRQQVQLLWGIVHEELATILNNMSHSQDRQTAFIRAIYSDRSPTAARALIKHCKKLINTCESILFESGPKDLEAQKQRLK